jgi:hypothetical protein
VEKREKRIGRLGVDNVGFVGVGDDGQRIVGREQRGQRNVVGEGREDVRESGTQFLGSAPILEAFFEMGKEFGGGDGSGFVGDGLGVFFQEARDLIGGQGRFFRDAFEHDFPIEVEQDFAEVEADGADFHGGNLTELTELQNLFDRINKIKMILKAGDFLSANPINHINPIKISPAFLPLIP